MERTEQRSLVEALILGSPEPIAATRIAEVVPYAKPAHVKKMIEELNGEYREQGRAFEIWEVAGGYQFRTLPEYAGQLQRIQPSRPLRLSQAALETLAIVAYRQPVTRGEIEHVRGVDAGAVVRSLLERKLVRIAGHREVAGRPMLYGTTRRFLEVFGLTRLEDLPSLRDIEELAKESGLVVEGASEEGEEPAPVELVVEGEPLAEPEPVDPVTAFHEAEPVGKPH